MKKIKAKDIEEKAQWLIDNSTALARYLSQTKHFRTLRIEFRSFNYEGSTAIEIQIYDSNAGHFGLASPEGVERIIPMLESNELPNKKQLAILLKTVNEKSHD